MVKAFTDLADIDEDKRIDIIGDIVTQTKKIAAIAVDNWPGKADRYIRKLNQRWPEVEILGKTTDTKRKITFIRVGPRKPAETS